MQMISGIFLQPDCLLPYNGPTPWLWLLSVFISISVLYSSKSFIVSIRAAALTHKL